MATFYFDGYRIEKKNGAFGVIWQKWHNMWLVDTYCPWNGDPKPDWVPEES